MMFHNTCAALLRRVLETEDDNSEEHAIKLCSLELALGRPQGGKNAGRFSHIDYESVGWDKVDLRPFWQEEGDPGENTFEWQALRDQGLDWVLSKPDMYVLYNDVVLALTTFTVSRDSSQKFLRHDWPPPQLLTILEPTSSPPSLLILFMLSSMFLPYCHT
jgi:hypothetical protein